MAFPGKEESIRPWVLKTFGKGISIVENGVNGDVLEELDCYFRGQLKEFKCDLDLKGTSFQKKIWEALRGIPYGQTIAAYAVGDAHTNLLNPFWAIPLLAITGLRARDMFGYAITMMLLLIPFLAVTLYFLPY